MPEPGSGSPAGTANLMPVAALTAILCLAQVLGMLSTSAFPALIPSFAAAWDLSNSAAGLVSGAYFAGYVAAVPVLVSLTDRSDARAIYLGSQLLGAVAALAFALLAEGFWSALVLRVLGGIGLAGTYMVGARLLSDRVEAGTAQTRAIAWYTAHFGIGTALSVLIAGEVASRLDWSWAYAVAAAGHLAAAGLILLAPRRRRPPAPTAGNVLDLRPVLRNRPAMAYILAYAAHVWELFAFRTWLVAFLTFAMAARPEEPPIAGGLSATQVATALLLLGMPASVLGNEAAEHFGRRRAVGVVMTASALLAFVLGFTADWPVGWMLTAFAVYGITVMADSGALTAGAVAVSEPARRGATMALHTLLGFAAGVLGPLAAGGVLDLAGGEASVTAWGLAFATMGLGALAGPAVLRRIGRREEQG